MCVLSVYVCVCSLWLCPCLCLCETARETEERERSCQLFHFTVGVGEVQMSEEDRYKHISVKVVSKGQTAEQILPDKVTK